MTGGGSLSPCRGPVTDAVRFDTDTGRFMKADGTILPVTATRKRGRWQYRTESGKIIASGMTPAQFAQEFWFADIEDN